jgi:hypothetical protein
MLMYVSMAFRKGVERAVWLRNENVRTLVARCCDQPGGFLPTAVWVLIETDSGHLHPVDLTNTFLKHVPLLQTVENWLCSRRSLFRDDLEHDSL